MTAAIVDLAARRCARGGPPVVDLVGTAIRTVNGIAVGDRVALPDGQRGRVALFRWPALDEAPDPHAHPGVIAVVFVQFRHIPTPAATLTRLFPDP